MSVKTTIKGLFGGLRRWRRRKAAIHHLKTLDECHLRDIGIKRVEIEAVVNGQRKPCRNAQSFRHEWRFRNRMAIIHLPWFAHTLWERGRW